MTALGPGGLKRGHVKSPLSLPLLCVRGFLQALVAVCQLIIYLWFPNNITIIDIWRCVLVFSAYFNCVPPPNIYI